MDARTKAIGYSYRPCAFWISLFVIGIGYILFNAGYNSKLVTPLDKRVYVDKEEKFHLPELYPRFNALVYSVETFVPLLKLGIASIGSLTIHVTTGLWLHIMAGWVLTALWVGGLTKLVKDLTPRLVTYEKSPKDFWR